MDAEQGKVFEVECPCCRTVIWVDGETGAVVKSEKAAKKKESLDELLLKEKRKTEGFAAKFEATADLEKKKRKLANEKFAKAFGNLDGEEPETPRNED
jgi:Zn-finger nucleic acid-binding protein